MALDDAGTTPLLRLSAYLADPAAWVAGDYGLADGARAMLASSRVTRPVLNRWLAERAGIANLGFDARFVAALDENEEISRGLGLCLADRETLDRIARFFAAAIWQDRLRLAVLKADREALLAELGPDALDFGLRRAPVFARALQEVPLPRDMGAGPAGVALCAALIDRAHPALFALFRLRFPDPPAAPVALSEKQVQTAWALIALQGIIL